MAQQGAGGEQRCLERICDALLKTFNEPVRYRNERLTHVETRIVQFFVNAHDESADIESGLALSRGTVLVLGES